MYNVSIITKLTKEYTFDLDDYQKATLQIDFRIDYNNLISEINKRVKIGDKHRGCIQYKIKGNTYDNEFLLINRLATSRCLLQLTYFILFI